MNLIITLKEQESEILWKVALNIDMILPMLFVKIKEKVSKSLINTK